MSELTQYRPTADVVEYRDDPTGGRLVAWAEAAVAAHSLATSLASTTFVPKHFQGKPGDATAAIILGDELGLSPLSALRSIHVISGTPGLYARTMAALVLSHGHEIWTEEETEQKVTVAGRRRGSEHVERVTWTIARATKAGYTSNAKYRTDPIAMLYARASGDVARRIAPDVLAGVPYSIEEIELAEVATVTVSREPAETKRVARAPKPEPVEPAFDEPAVDVAAPSEVVAPAEVEPDGITPAQLKKMAAGMRDAGITERGHALAYVAQAIGREVESRNDLTKAEASRVIDALESDTDAPSDADWDLMGQPVTS